MGTGAQGEAIQQRSAPEPDRRGRPLRRDQTHDRDPQPAARNLLREAQRQAREIVESLQQALEEMESVERLLDQVARERREDLHEVEALRRSLDMLRSHRASPRFSGPRSQHSAAPSSQSVDETGEVS